MAVARIQNIARPDCSLCGSGGNLLYQQVVDPFFGAEGQWDVKACSSPVCGLLWLDPRPRDEDLHMAYTAYFTHAGEAETQGSGFRDFLYRVYRSGMSVPAWITGLLAEQRKLDAMYLHDLAPGKLLDVGCGDGKFLNRMQRRGWAPHGVDFDEAAIKSAKGQFGLELHRGDLQSAQFPSEHFQAVTLNHVIEHVPDPVALLREVRRITARNGRIVITTPNAKSRGRTLFQQYWFGLDAPRHLQLFNPGNLKTAAERAGLKVLRSFSTAARADIFFGASESIQSAPGHRAQNQPPPNLGRTLRAVFHQFSEHAQLRSDPEIGEEVVVIAEPSSTD